MPVPIASPDSCRSLRQSLVARGRDQLHHVWSARVLIALIVTCMALLAVRVDFRTTDSAAFAAPGWDRHLYLAMSDGNPFAFHLAPYCWRVLVPSLVAVSPLTGQVTMLVLTVASLATTAVALYLLVLRWTRPGSALVAVVLFFSMGWGAKYLMSDFWLPDALVFAIVTVAILLAAQGRLLPFAIVLAVGAATKESCLAVAPLFYTLNAKRPLDGAAALRTMAAVLPAVAVIFGLRIGIEAWNGDLAYVRSLPPAISRVPELFPHYSYLDLLHDVGKEQRLRYLGVDTFHEYTWRTFGVIPLLLALVSLRSSWRWALRFAPFVVLVYAQTLFATDTERLLVLAFPAILILAAIGLEDVLTATAATPRVAWAIAGLSFAPNLVDTGVYAPAGIAQISAALAGVVAFAVATVLAKTPMPVQEDRSLP